VDVNSEVLKKGHRAVKRTSRITSELDDSDNNVAIVKNVRKESWVIIPDKV